jgi:hypothetical protein
MTKQCRNCGIEKPLENYPKHKSTKDGYDTLCKICTNEYAKQRRLNNIEKERERYQRYKENNERERLLNSIIEKTCTICNQTKNIVEFSTHQTNKDGYNNKCKICVNDYSKNHRNENIEKELERAKNYYINNKDKKKEYAELNKEHIANKNKLYNINNKETISERRKTWYLANKEIINKKGYEYYKMKMATDPIFKLKKQLKGLIRDSLRSQGLKKSDRTINVLGCTIEEFKLHLESKFEPWMTWENKGLYNGELNYGWDIDHITPTSSGSTYEEIITLNHYTNLQPLCGYYNRHIKRNNPI